MKKLLPIVFLLFPLFAYASSGGCSDHAGVNCSAGAGPSGNVICNDGWGGSSVNYYSMAECTTPTISSCIAPVELCVPEAETQWQSLCAQKQAQDAAYCARIGTSAAAYGGNGNAPCNPPPQPATYCAQATLCQTQIDAYNSAKQVFNTCIANQVQQNAEQSQEQQNALLSQLQQSQAELKQLNLNKTCGDALATYNQTSGKCECETGYFYTDGKCETNEEDAKRILDQVIASSSLKTATRPTTTPHTGTPPTPHKSPLVAGIMSGFTPTSTTSASSTIATTSATLPPHVSAGFFNRVYGFIGSFFGLFGLH